MGKKSKNKRLMHYMKKQMRKKKYEFCDINYQLWQAVNRVKFTQSPKKQKKKDVHKLWDF